MTEQPAPTAPQERVAALDILRGFALLGIFVMNLPGFEASWFADSGVGQLPHAYDRIAASLRDVLASGKFNGLFSFLLGVGFTIQLERLEARDPRNATRIYTRRLLILLALGLLHGMVFWAQDVLHKLALLGFLLLGLRRLGDRWVIGLIAALPFVPFLVVLACLPLLTPDFMAHKEALARAFVVSNDLAYGHGSFADAVKETARQFLFMYSDPAMLNVAVKFYCELATTLLLGLLAGRHRWIQRAGEHPQLLRRVQLGSLLVAILATVVQALTSLDFDRSVVGLLINVAAAIGFRVQRVSLMAFYVTSILRLTQHPGWRGWLAPVAAAGRMPLTNYLLQTAMGLVLFYGWGLGLWGKVGPLALALMSMLLYLLVQLPLSALWLRNLAYGPCEYLWRAATYGRLPSLRVPAGQALGAAE
jgi:uncharacterized protein